MSNTKQQVSIHRALAELKLIDSKVAKQIEELTAVGLYQKDSKINAWIDKDEFQTAAQSKFDSINDLIERKQKIKSAIVAANGKTSVTIGKSVMTIAEAINYKQIVGLKKQLLVKMAAQAKSVLADMEKKNTIVEQNMQRILEATFGKDTAKVDKNDMESVRKPYMEANEFKMFDPLKAVEVASTMSQAVAEFESEIDAALSEVNAITLIEI